MVNIFNCNTKELKALVEYKEILENDLRFTKDFWTVEKNLVCGERLICRILTRYCLENIEGIEVNTLSKYNLKQIKQILIKNKLFGMIQSVFNHDILSLLKNTYPEDFRCRILKEWMWSKHGIWNDNNKIIEAVKDMVRREGIKDINDIPLFDWKKRLIKYGIYNVLARFNWSIFALFDFVYPNKFHTADFKYKTKWAASESLDNAYYFMQKTFKKNRYDYNRILLLGTSDFRRLGLAGMLMAMFDSSTLKAKEYYLYKTLGNDENIKELSDRINSLVKKQLDDEIKAKLSAVATGKSIYNLHGNSTLYGYIKRHAKGANMSINDFISSYGFIYKSAKKEIMELDKDEIWNLRKQGLTYVQIAQKLNSNPTTITEICNRSFGGDPLIPRPLEDYTTVQELMDKYHVDHKTIMKIVTENNFENHTTIRFRYLKKNEIIPELEKYTENNKQHKYLVKRYAFT